MGKILRPKQVAEMFNVSTDAVRNWCKIGALESFMTPGGHYRITEEAVQKFRFSNDDFQVAINRETAAVEKLKKQIKAAKQENLRLQHAKLQKQFAKLRIEKPDKDEQIRQMLLQGKHYPEIELVLKTSSSLISNVSKLMKMEMVT